jgi:hypothetical protein
VIDFRYHLVSIVAVFLALAIGIVLGSTELQGNTIDVLKSTSASLSNQLNTVRTERDGYQQQSSADQQFLATAEPKLLARALAGDRIVIVTEPGASGAVVSGIRQAAGNAGATITGVVALATKFNDLSGTNLSTLSAINQDLASADGTTLATPADPQTADQQQAAQLIATAILSTTAAGTAGGLSAADAQTLLAAYAQAGYLTVTDATARATLAVIVTPQTTPADGQNDPASQVLLALALQFAEASDATIVVGSTAASAAAGSAISVLRSSSVSSKVSSVDNADTTLGQISSIWALENQKAGGKPNSYGLSGASAVSPVPLPEPSATVTTTPTPHPSATKGKGTKSVKSK